MSNEIAAVEVCDDAGSCSRQAFGPSDKQVLSRSFLVSAAGDDGKVRLTVRGFRDDGTEAVSDVAVAKQSKGDCGCKGPAEFFVSTEGVETMSG